MKIPDYVIDSTDQILNSPYPDGEAIFYVNSLTVANYAKHLQFRQEMEESIKELSKFNVESSIDIYDNSAWKTFTEISWSLGLLAIFSTLAFFLGCVLQQNDAIKAGVAEWHQTPKGMEFRYLKVDR